jgi:hypothetical protein
MLSSLRRIADTLLALGVLSLSISMLSSVSIECGTGESGCVASVLTASFATPDFNTSHLSSPYTAETTPIVGTVNDGMTLTEFNTAIQLVSAYALLVAVLVLIGLECLELHYLKRFLRFKKKVH